MVAKKTSPFANDDKLLNDPNLFPESCCDTVRDNCKNVNFILERKFKRAFLHVHVVYGLIHGIFRKDIVKLVFVVTSKFRKQVNYIPVLKIYFTKIFSAFSKM